jgi:hypothetical protein
VRPFSFFLALLLAAPVLAQDEAAGPAALAAFQALEDAWRARDLEAYLALWRFETPEAAATEREFATSRLEGETQLRLHAPAPDTVPSEARRLGAAAELVTSDEPWGQIEQLLFRMERTEAGWRLVSRQVVGEIGGLAHLAIEPGGFLAAGRTLRLPDFELEMKSGTLFLSPAALGPTVLVFNGEGRVRFRPHLAREREQLRKYSGRPELDRPTRQAFVRLSPAEFTELVSGGELVADPEAAKRWPAARRYYDTHVESAFTLDAAVAGSPWWIIPPLGDALVVFEQKEGPLTLSISDGRPEGISLFDRQRRRQICLYPAEGRPRDFDEDEGRLADILHEDVRVKIDPYTFRLEGEARLRVRLLAPTSHLRLRLNEALRISSVTSEEGRPHLHFRVRNQGSLMIALRPGLEEQVTLTIRYQGVLRPAPFERESAAPEDPAPISSEIEALTVTDAVTVFSQPAGWYPQAESDDFATASVDVELPSGWTCIGPGRRTVSAPTSTATVTHLEVDRPVKHVAVAIGRLTEAGTTTSAGVEITAFATSRLRSDAKRMLPMAADILRVLMEEFGPCPYDRVPLVFMEGANPGGHSPPGLAILVQRPITLRAVYNDPANFIDVPGFFLAHELAHQWWGDGVAGRSYHDRWISEGTAQYAAALWVRRSRGEGAFRDVMSDMASWAIRKNDAGPLELGHRIGHLEGDSKLFRAVVYDKAAWVLHMLRGIVGDEPFREGLIGYQAAHRFSKAGTSELREALENASGRDLKAYFESWVYGTDLPTLSLSHRQETVGERFRTTVTVSARELPGPVPLTVTLRHLGGTESRTETLAVDGGRWEYVTPFPPRKVEINEDQRLLARRD